MTRADESNALPPPPLPADEEPTSEVKSERPESGPVTLLKGSRRAAEEGRHAEALDGYRWLIHHGVQADASFDDLIHSLLVPSLVQLSREFSDAHTYVESLITTLESEVRGGDFSRWDLLVMLSQQLGTHERLLDLFEHVESEGRVADEEAEAMSRRFDDAVLSARRPQLFLKLKQRRLNTIKAGVRDVEEKKLAYAEQYLELAVASLRAGEVEEAEGYLDEAVRLSGDAKLLEKVAALRGTGE